MQRFGLKVTSCVQINLIRLHLLKLLKKTMKKMKIFSASSLSALALSTMLFFSACTTDPCKDVVCENDGTCNDGTCDCTAGYEGDDCSTEMRAKFVGTFNISGTVSCPVSGTYTIPPGTSITVANSSAGVDKIIINLLGRALVATVDGSSLTIATQQVGDFTYTGTGTITNNNLSMTINEFDSTIPETCVYTVSGVKQ
jgi:hypothetical protein